MKKKTPRVALIVVVVVGVVLIGFVMWMLFPVRSVRPWEKLPQDAFAFVHLPLAEAGPELDPVFDLFQERAAGHHRSPLERKIIDFGFNVFLPHSITVVAGYEEGSARPRMVAFVRMGRTTRLVRLFNKRLAGALFEEGYEKHSHGRRTYMVAAGDGRAGMRAYTVYRDSLMAGSSVDSVARCFETPVGKQRVADAQGGETSLKERLQHLEPDVFTMFVDNREGRITELAGAMQERFSFAAFPSADAVEWIAGHIQLHPEKLSGTVRFSCLDEQRIGEVRSDVRYFYGAIRRKLRASNLDLQGTVEVEPASVLFQFQIENYLDAFFEEDDIDGNGDAG